MIHFRDRPAVSGNRCHRRHLCRTFCRSLGRQQNRHKSDHRTAYQTDRANSEYRSRRKFTADAVTQQRADRPGDDRTCDQADRDRCFAPVQRLQPYETDHLLPAGADTAHHAKELCTLGNIAVHSSGDHQHSGQQHQDKQDRRDPIEIFHGLTAALTGKPHNGRIFTDTFLRQIILLPDFRDRIRCFRRAPELHIADRDGV